MAQTLSAPNKIIDIYKKLVFINRGNDGEGYLTDTSGSDATDVYLGNLQNDFILSGNISFINTIQGEHYTNPTKLDEVLVALYGPIPAQGGNTGYFYYDSLGAFGVGGNNFDDTEIRASLETSLPDAIVVESNQRYQETSGLTAQVNDFCNILGLTFGESITWTEPTWTRINLDNLDAVSDQDPSNFNDVLDRLDTKLTNDLTWLRGLQLKMDSGTSSDGNSFQTSYLNSILTHTNYLNGAGDEYNHGGTIALNSTPVDMLDAFAILDDRIYNREKEIDALDTRLNLSTSTNPDGTAGSSVWNGITFHGTKVSNLGNEIDFEASETLLATQSTDPAPNLGDAINKLIDRDERVQGMMDKRLTGTDTYTDATTAENLQEAFNRIDHLDSAISNLRTYSFLSDLEAAYVPGNPQGDSPATYNDLTAFTGHNYVTANTLEGALLNLDSKIALIETFLTGSTSSNTTNPNTNFETSVNNSGDGTNASLEDTLNKIVNWFEQFCTVSGTTPNPKALSAYSFDDHVAIESGHNLTVAQGNITASDGDLSITGDGTFTGDILAQRLTTYGAIEVGAGPNNFDGDITLTVGNITLNSGSIALSGDVSSFGSLSGVSLDINGDADISGVLNMSSGDITMAGNEITGLSVNMNPPSDYAASAGWVRSVAVGREWDNAVDAVSNSNISLTSPGSPDGVTLSVGMRVCLIAQTTATQNGVYEVDGSGNLVRPSSGPWTTNINQGCPAFTSMYVKAGTTYIDTVMTVDSTILAGYTIDTDDINIIQTDALQSWTTGNVTYITNNTMNISGGDGIDANSGWTYGQANGSLSIDLASTPGLEFNSAKLRAKVDGNWIDRGASGLTLDSTKQTEHNHSYDITDGLNATTWNTANFISRIESIDQSLTQSSDVNFNTVTADLTGDVTGNVVGNVTGNCTGTSNHWNSNMTLTLGGDLSGSVSFDGSSGETLTATVANDSHTHDNRYYTESEIDTKLTDSGQWDSAYTHSLVTTGNPHSVTKSDVGLGNVENTAVADMAISNATQTALDDKVSLYDGNAQNSQQIINSPLKLNQGSGLTEIENTYSVDQHTVLKLNSPETGNSGINCENAYFVASTRSAVGRNGFAGLFLETSDNGLGNCKSFLIGAKEEDVNSVSFYVQSSVLGDYQNVAFQPAFRINHDKSAKLFNDLEVDGTLNVDAIIGSAIAAVSSGVTTIPTGDHVYDFVTGHVGSTAFTLQSAEGSMTTGTNDEVPTVGAVVDYVANNSPATGVTDIIATAPLQVDQASGSVTISMGSLSTDDNTTTNPADYDSVEDDYTWDCGSSGNKEFQIFRKSSNNGDIYIDIGNDDVSGTWKLLVEYDDPDAGLVRIRKSNGASFTLYSLWGGALLSPPADERKADLIVINKFNNDYATISVVSPLNELGI